MLRYTWEWKPTRSQSQNLNTKEGRHFFLWEKKLKERNCGGIELCLSPHQKEENITFILQIETLFILSSYISTITFWALCCLHQMSEIQSDYYLQVSHLAAIRYKQQIQWQPEVLTAYTDNIGKNTSLGTKKIEK